MKVLFLRPSSAFLPEVDAYVVALEAAGIVTEIRGTEYSPVERTDVDLVYRFGGLLRSPASQIPEIHEYSSASTGRFPLLKNRLKSLLNSQPVARVFLNEFVESQFKFRKGAPFIFRDMGVSPQFVNVRTNEEKTHDLVYAGTIDGRAGVLEHLVSLAKAGFRIAVAGRANPRTSQILHETPGISFLGQLKPEAVPALVASATHGLNLMPNRYPYHSQTSTKVLEYLAAGLTVVSNSYPWIEQHSRQLGYEYISIDIAQGKVPRRLPTSHPLDTEQVERLTWSHVLSQSGLVRFISGL